MKGKFITFEGSEGSGKSTQIDLAKSYLESQGRDVVFLREPGGVTISEKIREILLDPNYFQMGKECETLLYMAARAQLVTERILPELQNNKIVLCDRFLDSTIAYQGYGCGVDIDHIISVGKFATQGIEPHLTLLFDLDVEEGFARIQREKDRIEQRDLDYHNKVREGYLSIAHQNTERVVIIDASQSKELIQEIVQEHLNKILEV